jgi:hypothetical protein
MIALAAAVTIRINPAFMAAQRAMSTWHKRGVALCAYTQFELFHRLYRSAGNRRTVWGASPTAANDPVAERVGRRGALGLPVQDLRQDGSDHGIGYMLEPRPGS